MYIQVKRWLTIVLLFGVMLPTSDVWADQEALGETGTDPRDFAPKFMPYYRYTETENGIEQQDVTLFGLYAFSKKFAMTYEIPLGREIDVSGTSLFNPEQGQCGGFLPGGGNPMLPNGTPAEGDCKETGVGDMNLRFMYSTDWKALGGDWLIGAQLDFPTASESVLGSESMNIGPMVAYVKDIEAYPAPGAFFALMNFYFFDVFKDEGRPDTSMYVGRWFVMLPLRPPGDGFFDGIYMLPEFQPVYDFENDHFSFWVGPEFGKMLSPGTIVYLKPGWGVDPDFAHGDREFTFEMGFRYFMD